MVILDEFNQLNPIVQKALNSVMEDNRTLGYIDGGEDITAKDGFGLLITYNPSTGVANEDLEPAVRDRCKVFYFHDIPKELKLRIALLRSGRFGLFDLLENGMSLRGINKNGNDYRFAELKGNKWYVYGADKEITDVKTHAYLHYDHNKASPIHFHDERKQEYYQIGRGIHQQIIGLMKMV